MDPLVMLIAPEACMIMQAWCVWHVQCLPAEQMLSGAADVLGNANLYDTWVSGWLRCASSTNELQCVAIVLMQLDLPGYFKPPSFTETESGQTQTTAKASSKV